MVRRCGGQGRRRQLWCDGRVGGKSVENVSTSYDFHATMLHLLGLDHERLTWYHNGINRRLTDVHGHVIREILA
ncbi:MAG: DUF1501 domain-containing protein [Bryobacterales bacterium]